MGRRGFTRSLLLLCCFGLSSASASLPPIYDAWTDGASADAIAANTDATADDSNRVRCPVFVFRFSSFRIFFFPDDIAQAETRLLDSFRLNIARTLLLSLLLPSV
jgi:hypothetical protein